MTIKTLIKTVPNKQKIMTTKSILKDHTIKKVMKTVIKKNLQLSNLKLKILIQKSSLKSTSKSSTKPLVN